MDYQWDFGVVVENLPVLLRGVVVTFQLWSICLAASLAIGLVVCLGGLSRYSWLRQVSRVYVEIFRNIPGLIQLIWFFYAFPILIGAQLTPFVAAFLGITLNASAYAAEIFRGGIQSLESGQWEGASALGFSRKAALRRVILPQAFQRMLPAFTNRAVEIAKVTSLASVLSVHDLMYQGRLLSSTYYRPMEILTAVAIIYFLLIFPFSSLSSWLEKRLARRL